MKRLFLLSMMMLALAAGCNALDLTGDDPQTKAEASQYVDELMQAFRDGKLHSVYCPNVQWSHIPANPISSFMMFECSEGMFALWMVEAARIHTLDTETPSFGGWPSQNPFVQRMNETDAPPTWYPNDPAVQQEVLDAYVNWWKASKGKKSAASIDPLEGTGYRWH